MRLFLSSYRVGNNPNKLVELVGNNKRVAMIANAQDYKSSVERNEKVAAELEDLNALGFEAFEVDLRQFFDSIITLNDLRDCGLVWVRGGNVFVLRLAMKLSGFDQLLHDCLENDKFVYGGFSAGGCVLSPSLKGFDIVDDASLTKSSYGLMADYSGLGLLDYHFEPHYKSDHPESVDIDKEIAKLKKMGLPYKTLRDGEAILINGKKEELLK
ncbi:MAG: Type 1 glutamine amidotransferase-like domain-containing protein [bacterium]|nr:Type 1 glutamine amidotransferase-like domain-containing protein [bacterium]